MRSRSSRSIQANSPISLLSRSIPGTTNTPKIRACTACQQRKVKCDRIFPCSNCVKSQTQCIPAAQSQHAQGRSKRELSARLRKYEQLLSKNNIAFEPLFADGHDVIARGTIGVSSDCKKEWNPPSASLKATAGDTPNKGGMMRPLMPRTASQFAGSVRGNSHSMRIEADGNDNLRLKESAHELAAKQAVNESTDYTDGLLFGMGTREVDTRSLHPAPAQLFKLWQVYLDNVDPLLKITHTLTLQRRIVDIARPLTMIQDHNLEALLFGIYCISVLSLRHEECQEAFGKSKDHLLGRYQLGCRQALWNCGFTRTSNRECLTALLLYLLSVEPQTVPRSLSTVLAVAIRIAQNMGLHSEVALANHPPVEAELRRRLWWALIIFDARMCELAGSKIRTLDPTWDCKVPSNLNDCDLNMGLVSPRVPIRPTEAIFVVLRCEIRNFARYSAFHINFISPSFSYLARSGQNGTVPTAVELEHMETMIERNYLQVCNEADPLQLMAIWTTRAYLAKLRLLEYQSSHSSLQQTDTQQETAASFAMRMLDNDTRIMTSHLTRRYHWLNHQYFPFLAYMQITHYLKTRSDNGTLRHAWECMDGNYKAWSSRLILNRAFFNAFSKIIVHTWEVCEKNLQQSSAIFEVPNLVLSIKQRLKEITQQQGSKERTSPFLGMHSWSDEGETSMPIDHTAQGPLPETVLQHSDGLTMPDMFQDTLGPMLGDFDLQGMDWRVFDGHS